MLSFCTTTLTLDASSSTGSAGRAFQSWSWEKIPSENITDNELQAIDAVANVNGAILSIQASLLNTDEEHSINITATNFLGASTTFELKVK